jgi:hypothetical protein
VKECVSNAENPSLPPRKGKKIKGISTAARTGHKTTRAAGIASASTTDNLRSRPSTDMTNAATDRTLGEQMDGDRQTGQPVSGRYQQGPGETSASDVATSKAIVTDPSLATSNKLVTELRQVISCQHEEIQRLRFQLDYVLSFLGITETCEETTPAAIPSAHEDDAANSPAVNEGNGQTQWSDVVSKRQRQRQRQTENFQQSMVAAVYVDQTLKSRREASLIVAGLEPAVGTADAELFTSVCIAEFAIEPDITYTKRLGRSQVGKIQPLLVYLKRADQAQHLIKEATRLRQSLNPTTRSKIFINQNLTRAEAAAAYQIRLKRRQALQRRQQVRSADANRCVDHEPTTDDDAPMNSRGFHSNSSFAIDTMRLNPSAEAFIPPVPSASTSAD